MSVRTTDANDKRSSQNENDMQNVGSWCDRVKIVAGDGSGLVLFWKRLEQGAFRWPPICDGTMRLSASQLAALLDGLDWSRLHARDAARPAVIA